MTRLMLLERGEELSLANVQALISAAAPVRLKLLEPAPPFGEGQILHVGPVRRGGTPAGKLVLCCDGAAFRLHPLADGPGDPAGVLGQVVALGRGSLIFSLERGVLAHVPARWLPRALDALEILARFAHPFTPSLYLGSAEACLAGVREKYERQAEVRQYSSFSPAGLEAVEREIVERHFKPGGRLLDIGCGAGREALGFARAGFRVVGIDVAPRMIEAARANAGREGLEITFRVQSATELDEPPRSFDGAYWVGSYQHVPGRNLRIETLRRTARVLKADGVLILMVVYRAPRGLISRSRLVDFLRGVRARFASTWQVSEPGDGYTREVSEASDPHEECFFHDFDRPDDVRVEIEAAGLSAREVSPGWWVCSPRLAQPFCQAGNEGVSWHGRKVNSSI